MYASILDESNECEFADFAADVVEGGDDDDARSVIHDDINAGRFLEGANIAAFSADDAAFDFIAGDIDGGDCCF